MKSQAKTLNIQPTPIRSASGPGLTHEDLRVLRAPIPRDRLRVKIQAYNKDRTRAMLVPFLQHSDVQDRLEEVDPGWTTEVLKKKIGDIIYVRLRMSLKGVSRENVGEGNDPKAAYSDALKRCGMLFGVGRYLYDLEPAWVDYQEGRDRFRNWSIEDFDGATRETIPEKREAGPVSLPPLSAVQKPTRSREQLNKVLMNLYRPYLTRFPDTRFVELLTSRYGVAETRLMAVEQMENLVSFMEQKLNSAA